MSNDAAAYGLWACSGERSCVYERRAENGARFHGDFQELEHWSQQLDVLEELRSFGLDLTFEHTPFRECVFFDPDGRERVCRSAEPLWYLVRRGTEPGRLDQALKRQAIAAGVQIEFEESRDQLPGGGIVTYGPRRVDAIAAGYVFATDMGDAALGAVSDNLTSMRLREARPFAGCRAPAMPRSSVRATSPAHKREKENPWSLSADFCGYCSSESPSSF